MKILLNGFYVCFLVINYISKAWVLEILCIQNRKPQDDAKDASKMDVA